MKLDFQDFPMFLGNSFLNSFGAVPMEFEPSMTLADYFDTNPGLDTTRRRPAITVPPPGSAIGIGGDLTVEASASDDVALDCALFSFDIDGDGTLDGPSEIAAGVEREPGVFEAVFEDLSGPPGGRAVQVSPIDAAGNLGLTGVEVTVADAAAIEYTGPTSGTRGAEVVLRATLTDVSSGAPADGLAVTFHLGPREASGTTDEDGMVSARLLLDLEPGLHPLSVRFAGGEGYVPSEVTLPFTVVWELTFEDDLDRGTVYLNPSTREFRVETPDGRTPITGGADVRSLPGDVLVVTYHGPEVSLAGVFGTASGAFAAAARTGFGAGIHELHST